MKRITLIKLDNIGDYILFRFYLELLYNKGYKITLVGNKSWQALAEYYDGSFVDKFYWIDVNLFCTNRIYRQLVKLRANLFHTEILFSPTFSRRYFIEDHIAMWISAKKKITARDDLNNKNQITDIKSQKIYSKIIKIPDSIHFEFHRYLYLIESFLSTTFNHLKSPLLPTNIRIGKKYVVIAPGANEAFRQWSVQQFAQLTDYIISNFDLIVIISGSQSEEKLGQYILQESSFKDKIENRCGKTNLIDYCLLIQNSQFIIGNDSSAIHIAAATNTTAICISNGNHFSRFNPYPKEVSQNIHYIYPFNPNNSYNNYMNKYRSGSNLDINLIKFDEVAKLVNHLAENKL